MISQAFVIRLKPGAFAEYKRYHDTIPTEWPDLFAALRECGVVRRFIFEADPLVFVYAEVKEEDSYERFWATEVSERWLKLMEPLIELRPDGKPDAQFLPQIFAFEATEEA